MSAEQEVGTANLRGWSCGFDDGFKSGWEQARKFIADKIRAKRKQDRENKK